MELRAHSSQRLPVPTDKALAPAPLLKPAVPDAISMPVPLVESEITRPPDPMVTPEACMSTVEAECKVPPMEIGLPVAPRVKLMPLAEKLLPADCVKP